MIMTKYELKQKIARLKNELQEAENKLADMQRTFYIEDTEKPFKKWNITEMQNLNDISEKAFQWLVDNRESTILEYNQQASKTDKIELEK